MLEIRYQGLEHVSQRRISGYAAEVRALPEIDDLALNDRRQTVAERSEGQTTPPEVGLFGRLGPSQ